jgi:hypothetical protein
VETGYEVGQETPEPKENPSSGRRGAVGGVLITRIDGEGKEGKASSTKTTKLISTTHLL